MSFAAAALVAQFVRSRKEPSRARLCEIFPLNGLDVSFLEVEEDFGDLVLGWTLVREAFVETIKHSFDMIGDFF